MRNDMRSRLQIVAGKCLWGHYASLLSDFGICLVAVAVHSFASGLLFGAGGWAHYRLRHENGDQMTPR